jgi:hypothetical protein
MRELRDCGGHAARDRPPNYTFAGRNLEIASGEPVLSKSWAPSIRTRESKFILDRTPKAPSYVPTPHDVAHRNSDELADPLAGPRGCSHLVPIAKLMPPPLVFSATLPDSGPGNRMIVDSISGLQSRIPGRHIQSVARSTWTNLARAIDPASNDHLAAEAGWSAGDTAL